MRTRCHTRQRTRAGQAPGNGAAARQDPPIGSVNLMSSVAIPMRYVPAFSEHIPLRGYGEPEEFGWAAAFVLSPAASRITGAMRDDPGGRGCHQLDLSTRSRAKPPGPRCRGI